MKNPLQKSFFKKLKVFHPKVKVQDIAKILKLSISGAYSKMNGSNAITYDEAITLCLAFDVSIDAMMFQAPDNTAPYSFYSNSLKFTHQSYYEFINNASNHLKQIKHIPQLHITYISQELPITLLLQFPHLMSYKLCMWDMLNWEISTTFTEENLIFHAINEDIRMACNEFYHNYTLIPTTEMWHVNMLTSTYRQLHHSVNTGKIKNVIILRRIIDDLKNLIFYMEDMVRKGKKYLIDNPTIFNKKIEILVNDISTQNEMVLAKGYDFNIVYNAFDTPNYLRSSDIRVITYMDQIVEKVRKHGVKVMEPINAEYMQEFFNKLNYELETNTSQLLEKSLSHQ
jgi:hypothetical protein